MTEIRQADPSDPGFARLLGAHASLGVATTPADSDHMLTFKGPRPKNLTFWLAVDPDGAPAGMAALRALPCGDGELKSMHVALAARGGGIGGALLATVIAEARARGMPALRLETGTHPAYAPARALYARHGFDKTGPFGDYRPDPHCAYMVLGLTAKS